MTVKVDIDINKVLQHITENPGVSGISLQNQFQLTKHGIAAVSGMLDRSGKIRKVYRNRRGALFYAANYDGPISPESTTPATQNDKYISPTAKLLQRGIWGKGIDLGEENATTRESTDTEDVYRFTDSKKQGAYWR